MFAVILPGRPCLTSLTPLQENPPKFALSFPLAPNFSHIVVFMLPGNSLPPDAAAAVYLQFPGQEFKLLGAIGNEKQSAIFKVNLPGIGVSNGTAEGGMMMESTVPTISSSSGGTIPADATVNLGISVEPASTIQAQLAELKANNQSNATATVKRPPSTKFLAQKIIQNAFNFLSSFAGTTMNGQEVIPLKSFQDWWMKFERRVEADPGFLERDQD